MDFVFQGFQSGLPVWVYLLLAAATTGLAWWSYRKETAVRPLFRYLLVALRALAFFVLIVLLLNPFFESEETDFVRPEILMLFDNSASTGIVKGAYRGSDSYRQMISGLNLEALEERLAFKFYSIDSDVESTQPESLSFTGGRTNLFNAVEVIRNNEPDVRAAVIFSDGLFNQGSTPLFLSRELSTPVYTVALGDTSQLRDLIIRDIVSNDTGYLNTLHRIDVEIVNRGFPDETVEIQLRSGNEVMQSETVTPESSVSSHSVSFSFELNEEGLRQYEIVIPGKEAEWSLENNRQTFSVDVLDNRQRILSLAFEIHPDVNLVRTLLKQDENSELGTLTWLGDTRFVEGNRSVNPDTLDLLVLHGMPPAGVPAELSTWVENLAGTTPTLFMATPGHRDWSSNSISLPVSASSPVLYQSVSLLPALSTAEHPVMELPEVSYQGLPPLYAPTQGLTPSSGITILYNSSFQGSPTGQPLVLLQTVGNRRNAQLAGFGWSRIARSSNRVNRDFVETLIYNLVSWTASRPDDRMLEIEPAQQNFTGSESVIFNAFLSNESGEVEEEGVITVTLAGEEMESRIYNMRNSGNGRYQLDAGVFPEGVYRYEAVARKGNRIIDSRDGEFSVSSSNIEFVNTVRNDNLLRQISDATGGEFYTFLNVNSIWNEMDRAGLLEQEQISRTNLFYPYQHAFWFALVVLLLGTEWLLRKYVALP